ncbi:MAG: hypothetical protein AYP45_05375 [Candidatus Brocadia carolinensis]|uniref:Uncharacterized protein n=1 Tax=Candidatus Brocadia carolinensis TaxID=1004156 RepID=A0A1V4AVK8_9BACT|nr:MAG: hypothetical protein AYP45_05375 [Candidatus Brocadia caroliniensis]
MQTKQIKYQVVIIFILGVYLYYLVYRIRFTINPDALLLSISFFYADVHALFLCFSLPSSYGIHAKEKRHLH